MRPLNLLFVFSLANSAIAADVSPKTIIKYLNDKSVKTVITDIKPIILTGNEQAYLASAEYPDQGRNFVNGYVLYRPSQKKAMRIEGYGGQSNKIVGIYSYGPSVAHIESAGSGQGYFTTAHNLVTFDGWNVKELYSAKDENNSGNCGISEQLDKCYDLSLDQILIPCAIRSLAARKPSSLLCRASQPSQRAPQLAIPVRLLSIKPPSLAIAM